MRVSVASYLDQFRARGDTAFVHRRGLRVSRWTYGKIAEASWQFARELESRAIGRGDTVIIWGESSPEWVVAFFGCVLRGALAVPLDRMSAPDFARRVSDQVRPKLVVGDPTVRQHAGPIPFVVLEEVPELVTRHSSDPYSPERVELGDTAEVVFTSGTTAAPKGVRITHGNLLSNLEPLEGEIAKYLKWERPFHPIRFLNLLPLSHVFGQFMAVFIPQLLAGEVFLAESLSPAEIVETVRRQRISVIVAVPRVLQTLRAKIERDLDANGELARFQSDIDAAAEWGPAMRWWRFRTIHRLFGMKFWAFVSGGATLDAETETFWRRLGFAVIQGYGMTETASLVSVNHPFKMSHGSIGKVLPGQEIKLDASGEILVRGRNVTPGYWAGGDGDDGGWFHTGDLGEMDAEGNLYFKGRKKDVIVTAAGVNLHPEDLEAALDAQPEIRASAVVGLDGANGPEPVAALILDRADADPGEAVARANASLARHQEIRRWVVWPEPDFPRTTTSKVRRNAVAASIGAMLEGAGPETQGSSPLGELLGRIGSEKAASLDLRATLGGDLNLDSLARVELMSAIEERYQVDVDESAFTATTTIEDLESLIRRGGGGERIVSYPYPRWTRHLLVVWLRWLVFYALTLPAARLMCWVRAKGSERLRHERGPVLFVSNHVASADAALIMTALPGRFRRRMAVAMSGEMLAGFRRPPATTGVWSRLLAKVKYVLVVALFNVFPLPQRSGFRRSFAFAGELVDAGYSVLLFPEGLRTPDGQMSAFQSGVGVLATRLGVPVVPVRIDGLYEVKERGRLFVRPFTVSVSFGEEVTYRSDDDPEWIARDLERRVRNA